MFMSKNEGEAVAATALSGGNAAYIEDLYDQFLQDPSRSNPLGASISKGSLRALAARSPMG